MAAHPLRSLLPLAALVLIVTGCAGSSDGGAETGGSPLFPDEAVSAEVIGQGTVIQKEGESVQLCLGAITMIYPPDCGGLEVVGWDWDAVDGVEREPGTTWGTYAVQGDWDGEKLTVTQSPIMLALYDPMVEPDPYSDPSSPGMTSQSDLEGIQADLTANASDEILGSYIENGYLFVEVVFDDGALQERMDEEYGEGVVAVRSQLVPVD